MAFEPEASLCAMASALLFVAAGCGAADPEGESPASAVPQAEDAKEPVGQTKHALVAARFSGQCTSRQRRDLGIFHEWLYGWVSDANNALHNGQAEAPVRPGPRARPQPRRLGDL